MQNQLAILFQLIAQLEVQSNQLKQIDINSAFEQLSQGKQSFTFQDFEDQFREANHQDLIYVFKQMDRDNDGNISFKDFQIYMQVKSTSKSRDVQRLIKHELQAASQISNQLQKLKGNPQQLFKSLTQHQFLSQQALSDMLSKSFIKLKSHELNALHTYLDRNRDGFITLQDFQELLSQSNKIIVLKQNQEVKLVQALYEMMSLNQQLYDKKIALELQPDYDIKYFFGIFDTFKQGQITRLDFELACMDLNIYGKMTKQQIQLFFQRFSEDNSFLSLQSFSLAIQSNQDILLRIVDQISQKTLNQFKQLLIAILNTEDKIQQIKERLASHSEFSVELAFQQIDKLNIGSITIDEFRNIFELHNIYITNQEIESLMQIYKKNDQQKIGYTSFVNAMRP